MPRTVLSSKCERFSGRNHSNREILVHHGYFCPTGPIAAFQQLKRAEKFLCLWALVFTSQIISWDRALRESHSPLSSKARCTSLPLTRIGRRIIQPACRSLRKRDAFM